MRVLITSFIKRKSMAKADEKMNGPLGVISCLRLASS